MSEDMRKIIDKVKNFKEFINEGLNIDTKVQKNGKPLIMYHGGSFSGGEFKGYGWFTISKKDAKYYAEQSDGNLTKAYLIIKNPLYTGDIKHLNIPISKDILLSAKKRNILNSVVVENGIIQFIEANNGLLIAEDIGRDGVIDLHGGEIIDAIIFDSNQIVVL